MVYIHTLVRNLSMSAFPVRFRFLGSQFLRFPLILLALKLLPLVQGNDILPIHIILHITDSCK